MVTTTSDIFAVIIVVVTTPSNNFTFLFVFYVFALTLFSFVHCWISFLLLQYLFHSPLNNINSNLVEFVLRAEIQSDNVRVILLSNFKFTDLIFRYLNLKSSEKTTRLLKGKLLLETDGLKQAVGVQMHL